MGLFEITGGKKLKGEITPQGAKNEALQVICTTLLTSEKITISNIPEIRDVNKLIELLAALGVQIEKIGEGTFTFQSININLDYLHTEDFKAQASGLRGSIMIIGPLVARLVKGLFLNPVVIKSEDADLTRTLSDYKNSSLNFIMMKKITPIISLPNN